MSDDQINAHTELFGLFANPAQHSKSPTMHNASFRAVGYNAVYLAFNIPEDGIAAAVASMRTLNIRGVNLSMPFKQRVIPYLDEITERGRLLNSVNVIKNVAGHLTGDSVDGAGLFQALTADGISTAGQTLTIFGAGGAGLSIIQAAIDQGVATINVFKRRDARFSQIEDQINRLNPNQTTNLNLIDYDDEAKMAESIHDSQMVINATNLGMGNHAAELPAPPGVLEQLDGHQVVCDVIYAPAETKFLAFAKQQGCRTFNGLGMLIYQGALSFKWWTGKNMPVAQIKPIIQK